MKLPFRLEEGIYFEDSEQILLWNENFETLSKIDNPKISDSGKMLTWENKKCLGGQILDISISQDGIQNKGDFDFVHFEASKIDPHEMFKKYSNYFKSIFSNPDEMRDDGYGNPTELWNLNDLQIIVGVGERFMEYQIFGIHKGEKYWRLQE